MGHQAVMTLLGGNPCDDTVTLGTILENRSGLGLERAIEFLLTLTVEGRSVFSHLVKWADSEDARIGALFAVMDFVVLVDCIGTFDAKNMNQVQAYKVLYAKACTLDANVIEVVYDTAFANYLRNILSLAVISDTLLKAQVATRGVVGPALSKLDRLKPLWDTSFELRDEHLQTFIDCADLIDSDTVNLPEIVALAQDVKDATLERQASVIDVVAKALASIAKLQLHINQAGGECEPLRLLPNSACLLLVADVRYTMSAFNATMGRLEVYLKALSANSPHNLYTLPFCVLDCKRQIINNTFGAGRHRKADDAGVDDLVWPRDGPGSWHFLARKDRRVVGRHGVEDVPALEHALQIIG
jgi:hypothetical protein